jgi:hypothetical protein
MRSARTLIVAGIMAIALCACNPSADEDDASSSRSSTGPVASASPTDITVPVIPKGKVATKGDLCKLIPTDKAAEVLGLPSVTTQPWKTEMDPAVVDVCNVISDGFVMNVFYRSGGVETLRLARNILADGKDEVSEHTVEGYDEAFYARREGNLRKGDMLYVANHSVGEANEARTMAFLKMIADALS